MSGITRRGFVRLLALGVGGTLAAGCSSSQPSAPTQVSKGAAAPTQVAAPPAAPTQVPSKQESKPSSPKLLTVAQGTEMKTLDPGDETMVSGKAILANIFDSLVIRGNDGRINPVLAESWRIVNDTTWEFKLRKGVKFHNGQDFTAEDVKFSLERILNKDNNLGLRANLEAFKGAEVVDPYTIQITTRMTYPIFIAQIHRLLVLPAKTFQEQGKDAFTRKPIGTGPFKFVEWVRDDHLTMERNPSYWQAPPKIDRVDWKAIPEAATRIAALSTGAIQICYPVNPEDATVVERNPDLKIETVRSLRQAYLGLNHFEKPLDDVRVRRAIAHAIDVDGLIKTVMGGRAYRVAGVAGGPPIFGHDPNIKPYAYDPELSKRFLAEAGFPSGFEIDFVGMVGRLAKDVETVQAIGGQLEKVGIKAKVRTLEWGAYQSVFLNKQAKGLHIWSNSNVVQDADSHLANNLYSKGRGLYYNTPKTDDLIEQARSTLDEQVRLKLYSEIQRVMQEDVAVVPLWEFQDIYGISKRLTGFAPRPDELIYAAGLDLG